MNVRAFPFKLIPALWIAACACLLLAGCDSLFGSKQDDTTDEIFDAGRSEPGVINEVEYVPLFPFFSTGADGMEFDAPTDVYVGYDELIFVTDERGLHVLDTSGRPSIFVDIPGGATSVVQDRRLHVYVTARRDTMVNNQVWNLPVVLHYGPVSTGTVELVDILWHPFDDDSRRFNRPDPVDTDEDVEFTGVGVTYDNNIYVTRRGPVNDRSSVILPHNIVLEYTETGQIVRSIISLSPTQPSIRSSVYPTDVATFVHPPQRSFYPQERHFIVLQSPTLTDAVAGDNLLASPLRYSALSILVVPTPDGIEFQPDTQKLQAASNPDLGDGFMYEEFKFDNPSDVTVAADGTNYIFITDAAKDSLFVFTGLGVEGVQPPPGSQSRIPVVVSFGGEGDGARQFNRPLGVAYFDQIVYVADTGNNRISRFRLNTDFE